MFNRNEFTILLVKFDWCRTIPSVVWRFLFAPSLTKPNSSYNESRYSEFTMTYSAVSLMFMNEYYYGQKSRNSRHKTFN